MTEEILGREAAPRIAELCATAMRDAPSAGELESCLFADDEPAIVRGDPSVGVVASARSGDDGFIKLLAVAPEFQRQGHGSRLLAAAEADVLGDDGKATLTVGADAPYYLFPGVETSLTPMLGLLESRHYQRAEANYNMGLDLSRLPPSLPGPVRAGPDARDEVDAFMAAHWPNWRAEVIKALARGTLLVERDDKGILGFCAWDVNRGGLLGPIAVRLDLIGSGAGRALLIDALHCMRGEGRAHIEISWVGPLVPYARLGATVSRVFFVYRKKLRRPPR